MKSMFLGLNSLAALLFIKENIKFTLIMHSLRVHVTQIHDTQIFDIYCGRNVFNNIR